VPHDRDSQSKFEIALDSRGARCGPTRLLNIARLNLRLHSLLPRTQIPYNPSVHPGPRPQVTAMASPEPTFAIIPLAPYQPPPANYLAWGSLNCVMERIVDSNVRNDAIKLIHDAAVALGQLERTRSQEQQIFARGLQVINDAITAIARRLDALEEQREAQAKADAQAEADRVQRLLDAMPDPDGPDPFAPSGDLHSIPASNPQHEQQLEADQGGLPHELEQEAPPPGGAYTPLEELAYPTTPRYRSPAAVSMMSED
jgi:hypothetical protein